MKRFIVIISMLLIVTLLTSCGSFSGVGEQGEGANSGSTTSNSTNHDTPYNKAAGLYNSNTGALKYSWAELEAKGYITVDETVVTKSIKYIRGDLYIPNTISAVGNGAFSDCTGLVRVYVGNGVTTIGTKAFYGCTGLETVKLGTGITNISANAFANCTKFKEFEIPNSVTNIGTSAFMGCTGLAELSIGEAVTNVSQSAFANCTGLTSVKIGNSVTSIGTKAFSNCKVLYYVEYSGTKAEWYAINIGKNNTELWSAKIQATDGIVGEDNDESSKS